MANDAIRIPLEEVTSSNLVALGYDGPRSILAVKFKSGDIWHYAGVSLEVFAQLYGAPSKGQEYVKSIKGKFEGALMTGPCPKCGDKGWIGDRCETCGCAEYVAALRPEFRRTFIPTRVMVNDEYHATSFARASAAGIDPEVIFVRDDGWSLGAPKRLENAARSTWADKWVEQWRRTADGWVKSWPAPGDTPEAAPLPAGR